MVSPAALLVGKKLDGGWLVVEAVVPKPDATGGNFSYGYVVEGSENKRAFLKAIDIAWALTTVDPFRSLQEITQRFNFERDVCELCRNGKLDRVVTTLADGKVVVDPADPMSVVHYLIFELALGDVRNQLDAVAPLDALWALRCLHHVATGLSQLHKLEVAHQDVKPSNVLVFNPKNAKIADLGRASLKGGAAPHDGLKVAGDPTYAPPEGLYGFIDPEWNVRRLGCDLYHLGALIVTAGAF